MVSFVLDASVTLTWALAGEIHAETVRAWSRTAALVRRHGLTLYKAAYLEFAARRSLPLATFDGQLARAAATEKVSLAMDASP